LISSLRGKFESSFDSLRNEHARPEPAKQAAAPVIQEIERVAEVIKAAPAKKSVESAKVVGRADDMDASLGLEGHGVAARSGYSVGLHDQVSGAGYDGYGYGRDRLGYADDYGYGGYGIDAAYGGYGRDIGIGLDPGYAGYAREADTGYGAHALRRQLLQRGLIGGHAVDQRVHHQRLLEQEILERRLIEQQILEQRALDQRILE
jgi:hypothetical protein